MTASAQRRPLRHLAVVLVAATLSGCASWHGLNTVPLPGTQGRGPGAFTVKAQLPDVNNIQQNSRVRVGDVTVGTVTNIEREGWHALVTMRLNGDVNLPANANATATVGQTSLLGSLHIELAAPTDVPPRGKLSNGALIPLSSAGAYPSTEQTLAAVSLLLNGGGIGQIQDITAAFSTALAGRENTMRSLIDQLDIYTRSLDEQTAGIIAAIDSVNGLVSQFADSKPVLDNALRDIPDALAVLKAERDTLSDAIVHLGRFSAVTADAVGKTKADLVKELKDLGPVLDSLANAGPALT
ncbi:MAG TPA: MCE family protein, partial [Mycobacterium sp.]|nr:MCE family protein [Mycobacterium sp.]